MDLPSIARSRHGYRRYVSKETPRCDRVCSVFQGMTGVLKMYHQTHPSLLRDPIRWSYKMADFRTAKFLQIPRNIRFARIACHVRQPQLAYDLVHREGLFVFFCIRPGMRPGPS
jgi:hypothetical protein